MTHPFASGTLALGVLIATVSLPASRSVCGAQKDQRLRQTSRGQRQERNRVKLLRAEDSRRLRMQVLTAAKPELSVSLSNPENLQNGVERAIVQALQDQRAYIENSRPLVQRETGASQAQKNADSRSPAARKSSFSRQFLSPSSGNGFSVACTKPTVRTVNGKRTGVIFTPRVPDNFYRIEGCSLGNSRGKLQLVSGRPGLDEPLSTIVLRLDAAITAWSDTEIDVYVDPRLAGLSDFAVTLVVYPKTAPPLEFSGCIFVAARGEPQLLKTIPASWVRLQASMIRSRLVDQTEYSSPAVGGAGVPAGAVGASAFVVRSDAEAFGKGTDTYTLSHLNPGWVVDSVEVQTYQASCPGRLNRPKLIGRLRASWIWRGFRVAWQSAACSCHAPPNSDIEVSSSQYAMKVWVIGPVGTQPLPTRSRGNDEA